MKKRINISISEDLLREIDQVLSNSKKGKNRSRFISNMIEYYLDEERRIGDLISDIIGLLHKNNIEDEVLIDNIHRLYVKDLEEFYLMFDQTFKSKYYH